jgi:hypothetical protein
MSNIPSGLFAGLFAALAIKPARGKKGAAGSDPRRLPPEGNGPIVERDRRRAGQRASVPCVGPTRTALRSPLDLAETHHYKQHR